jgi:hypothetical protein
MKFDGNDDFAWVLNNRKLRSAANFTSTQTNPNFSLVHLFLIKIRVLFEFVIRSSLLLGTHRRALRQIRDLKDSSTGKKALVFANGPSVNLLDLEHSLFRSEEIDIFAVNFFPLSKLASQVTPKYLVLSDPLTHPNFASSKNQELWNWIQNNSDVNLYVPTSWYAAFRNKSISNKVVYFDDRTLIGWCQNVSPIHPRGYGSLTSYKALAIACFAGYSRIGIIGFDNSQFRSVYTSPQNRVYQKSLYFYDESSDLELSDSFQNGIADYFYDTSNTFSYLRMFVKFPIVNLDQNSLVDHFQKIQSLDEF